MSDEKINDLPPGVPRSNNGTGDAMANAAADPGAPVAPVNLNAAQIQFLAHCQAVLETSMWGTIVKFQGIGPNAVAVAFSQAMGTIVGTMFNGNLVDVLTIRRTCRDAFNKALATSPPPQPAPGQHPDPSFGPGYKQRVNGQ